MQDMMLQFLKSGDVLRNGAVNENLCELSRSVMSDRTPGRDGEQRTEIFESNKYLNQSMNILGISSSCSSAGSVALVNLRVYGHGSPSTPCRQRPRKQSAACRRIVKVRASRMRMPRAYRFYRAIYRRRCGV